MAARGGYLQRPLGEYLTLDIGEILTVWRILLRHIGMSRLGRNLLRTVERRGHLLQAIHRQHVDTLHNGRFGGILARDIYAPQALFACRRRDREHAPHTAHTPVERQLPHEGRIRKACGRHLLRCRKYRHGNGQIESRSLLAQVGRGKVDHTFACRHAEAPVLEGRAYALLALAHGIVRQPHKEEAQASARDAHLDRHPDGADTHDRTRKTANNHIRLFPILNRDRSLGSTLSITYISP